MRKIKYPFYTEADKEIFLNKYFEEISPQIPNQAEICKEIKKIDPKWNLKKLLNADFSELIEFVNNFNRFLSNLENEVKDKFSKNEEKEYITYYFSKFNKKSSVKKNKKTTITKEKKIEINKSIKEKLNFITHKEKSPYEDNFFFEKIINFFNNNFYFKSCFYCNIDYINIFDSDDVKRNHFTLDHVLPKSEYPFLSISLFNFVPCCYSCNSKFKHNKEFNINDNLPKIIPSATEYNFDELVQFKLKFKEKLDLKVELTNLSNIKNVDEYITMFKLKGRYQYHQKKAEDLIDKRKKYSDSQIKEISKLIGKDEQSIKKDIFGKECFESNNEPFEKYKQDIAIQLGLI